MKKQNKKGFTIVELVIVVAVIAILAAVLIPTFSNVVGSAKEAALASDAKALYTEYVAKQAEEGKDIADEVYVYVETVVEGEGASQQSVDYYLLVKNGVVQDKNRDEKITLEGDAYKGAELDGKTTYKK